MRNLMNQYYRLAVLTKEWASQKEEVAKVYIQAFITWDHISLYILLCVSELDILHYLHEVDYVFFICTRSESILDLLRSSPIINFKHGKNLL